MNKTVKVGLSGSGSMGRAVASLVNQAADGAVTIGAIFDPDPAAILASRKVFGDQFDLKPDFDSLVSDSSLDWIMIASWNRFHAAQAIAAFEAGKHVFCQKPLAISLDECLAMRAAWRASGKQFVIGFNLRYSPHYRRIKQLVASGSIGKLVSFEFNETLDFNHGGFIMGDWRRMYLCGTEGTLRADVLTGRIELRRIGFGEMLEEFDSIPSGMHGGGDEMLATELVTTMQRNEPTSTTLDDGLLAAVTCFGIDEAERTGQVVDLARYWAEVDN